MVTAYGAPARMGVVAIGASMVPTWRAAHLHPDVRASEGVNRLRQRKIQIVGQDTPTELARQREPFDQGRTMADP